MKRLPIKNLLNFHPELKGSEDKVLERKGLTTDFNTNELNEFESIGILSTPTVDAEGDILDPDGMDTSIFNGVVIFNHDLGELPLGSITEIKKSKEGVTGKFKFSETYSFAIDCYNLIKEKILRGISVGYLPTKVYRKGTTAFNELAAAKGWTTAGVERIIAGWQLIEVSICNVGCNSDALLLASKSFKSDIAFKNFKIEQKACGDKEIISEKIEDNSIETTIVEQVTETTEVPDILIVQEETDEEVPNQEVSEVDQTMPEGSEPEDTQTVQAAPVEPEQAPVASEEVAPVTEPVQEAIQHDEPKPMILKVIRKGKMIHTEEIKTKALRFLQGKSF